MTIPHYETPRFFDLSAGEGEDTSKSNRLNEVEEGAGKPIVAIADELHGVIGYSMSSFSELILAGLKALEEMPTIRCKKMGDTTDVSYVYWRDWIVKDEVIAKECIDELMEFHILTGHKNLPEH